jgi:hypothetical protein
VRSSPSPSRSQSRRPVAVAVAVTRHRRVLSHGDLIAVTVAVG